MEFKLPFILSIFSRNRLRFLCSFDQQLKPIAKIQSCHDFSIRQVELKPHAIDRYGRLVAMVYVEDADAGLEMLKAGMAWPYYRYLAEAPADVQYRYLAAGELAKNRGSGDAVNEAP